MPLINPKIISVISVASSLIKSGMEIIDLLKDKDNLSDADLQEIIAKQNDAQKVAREELAKLLD